MLIRAGAPAAQPLPVIGNVAPKLDAPWIYIRSGRPLGWRFQARPARVADGRERMTHIAFRGDARVPRASAAASGAREVGQRNDADEPADLVCDRDPPNFHLAHQELDVLDAAVDLRDANVAAHRV